MVASKWILYAKLMMTLQEHVNHVIKAIILREMIACLKEMKGIIFAKLNQEYFVSNVIKAIF